MTLSRFAPLRSVTSHFLSGAASGAAVALLTFATACGDGSQTSKSSATNPRKRTETPVGVDAGEGCPNFSEDYRDEHKACQVDADCEAVLVQVSCSGTHKVFGVATELREAFDRCAPTPASFNVCSRAASPTRTEDGRSVAKPDASDAVARCIAGKCQSRIEERQCGGKVCHLGELCVALQNGAGIDEYECASNPCTSELDCTCAESVCKLHSDRLRSCAIDHVAQSDVYCKNVVF